MPLIRLLLLLLLWCAAPPEALALDSLEAPVDLTAGWRLRRGDDPAWAAPDYDDSGWEEVDVAEAWAQQRHGEYAGPGWYRLELLLPPDAGARPLGVTVGAIEYSAYEIYAGGERIGAFGSLPPRPRTLAAAPRTFVLPEGAVDPAGRLVIAVRMWRDPDYRRVAAAFTRGRAGAFALGPPAALHDRVELERSRVLMADLSRLVCSVLFAVIGLYHLQLYRRRRELREYLWFGLLTLAVAVNFFVASAWSDGLMTPLAAYGVMMFMFHVNGGILWVQFLWGIFGWRIGPWMRAYQALHAALALLTLAAPGFVVVALDPLPLVALLPILVVWLVVIPREAWRGNRAARTILLGLACLAAARGYQVLMAFGLVPPYNFAHWGFAALLMSMAVSLSNRFNLVYGQLDALNQDLEGKVRRRTAELAETVERLRLSERQAREAREAAMEASKAKSTFLANMSHELRTPLNAILGFVQLLRRDRTLDADGRENLDIITHSGEHLLALINDILSISKIEAGRVTLNERAFDLHRLLRDLEETFQLRAEARELELRFDLAPGLPRYVLGDEGKLRQVLINLLGNAMKFTDRGSVTLRARWREARAFFEVEDTGHGIGEAELGGLFVPFTQTESGQKAKEGTGLGLAISRSIVRLMGGDITVRSALGEGTVFSTELSLPAAEEAEGEPEERIVIGLEPGQPSHRILVTDDTPENRRLLVKLLGAIGFEVREAVNGREAVEAWREWRPDLIFMDIRMPVMDGIEATRCIRSEGRERDPVKIIALTASAFEHDRDRILDAGCDDFMPKPFRDTALFERMARHLGVRFRYEEPKGRAERQGAVVVTLAGLPAELVADLNRYVTEGDVDGAYGVIDEIRARDASLAEELRRLVKGYRFDEILGAIEKR